MRSSMHRMDDITVAKSDAMNSPTKPGRIKGSRSTGHQAVGLVDLQFGAEAGIHGDGAKSGQGPGYVQIRFSIFP